MFKEKVGKRIKELREIKCGLNKENFSKKQDLINHTFLELKQENKILH